MGGLLLYIPTLNWCKSKFKWLSFATWQRRAFYSDVPCFWSTPFARLLGNAWGHFETTRPRGMQLNWSFPWGNKKPKPWSKKNTPKKGGRLKLVAFSWQGLLFLFRQKHLMGPVTAWILHVCHYVITMNIYSACHNVFHLMRLIHTKHMQIYYENWSPEATPQMCSPLIGQRNFERCTAMHIDWQRLIASACSGLRRVQNPWETRKKRILRLRMFFSTRIEHGWLMS